MKFIYIISLIYSLLGIIVPVLNFFNNSLRGLAVQAAIVLVIPSALYMVSFIYLKKIQSSYLKHVIAAFWLALAISVLIFQFMITYQNALLCCMLIGLLSIACCLLFIFKGKKISKVTKSRG